MDDGRLLVGAMHDASALILRSRVVEKEKQSLNNNTNLHGDLYVDNVMVHNRVYIGVWGR